MKRSHFVILQLVLVLLVGVVAYMHRDLVIVLKNPPESLSAWYKPENKRQEWLHNMFNLRREMQALRSYADSKQVNHLNKWAERFAQHYTKIGEMVPEWQRKLDMNAAGELEKSVLAKDMAGVVMALDKLDESCNTCHKDYRIVTAVKYRAPDFSRIKISEELSYVDHMGELIKYVNQIKIASEDGMPDMALHAFAELKKGMTETGATCKECHVKQDEKNYPDNKIETTMTRLETALSSGTVKEKGKELGTLAVQACAQCHGSHRLSFDVRDLFTNRPDWSELIKH